MPAKGAFACCAGPLPAPGMPALPTAGVTQETIEDSRSAVERAMLNDIHRLVKEGVDLNTPLDHSATLVRAVSERGCLGGSLHTPGLQ